MASNRYISQAVHMKCWSPSALIERSAKAMNLELGRRDGPAELGISLCHNSQLHHLKIKQTREIKHRPYKRKSTVVRYVVQYWYKA